MFCKISKIELIGDNISFKFKKYYEDELNSNENEFIKVITNNNQNEIILNKFYTQNIKTLKIVSHTIKDDKYIVKLDNHIPIYTKFKVEIKNWHNCYEYK